MDHLSSLPQQRSFTYIASIDDLFKETPIILGVDEAGRGPVLGPMVYAVCIVPKDKDLQLKALGVDDSKGLKETERERLFNLVQKTPWISWGMHVCTSKDLSESMQQNKISLNDTAHEATISLIKDIIALGVMLTEVYVDTVGPPDKYQLMLERVFPRLKIVVAKKADSLYPSVSAASICAKVNRDAMIRNWTFIEKMNMPPVSRVFGSGYPADPNTKKWLMESIDKVFGYPQIVRFSWATTKTLLDKYAVKVTWNYGMDDDSDEGKKVVSFLKRKIGFQNDENNDDRQAFNGSIKQTTEKENKSSFGMSKRINSSYLSTMGLEFVSSV